MNLDTLSSDTMARPQPEVINWSTLPRWARRTLLADQKTYVSTHRPLSLSRLTSAIFPGLRSPIFLIGSPRSGTTFLGQCLASLPNISYHFEPIATKAAARYVYDGTWSNFQSQWFYKNVYQWLLRSHLNGDLNFAEKTPRNCFLIPFLASTFPAAKFIHIVRDGRDVALSLSKKPWYVAEQAGSGRFEPGGYPYGPYAQFWVEPDRHDEFESTSDIHRCIWVWKRFTEAALQDLCALPESRAIEIRYESLVLEPKEEAKRLKDFLSIDQPSSFQLLLAALKKANPALSKQWKEQLCAQQLSTIEQEAGELLTSLNYGE